MRERESGFTLIELLVAILAAVAVPVFLRQRQKGYEDQIRTSLKNAATAVESHSTENDGSYLALDGLSEANPALLTAQGFPMSDYLEQLRIEANADHYCIKGRHATITGGVGQPGSWRQATYESSVGEPRPDPNNCPAL